MHAHFDSPFHHLHWTAGQLADAVPLRLHEMFAFDAARNDVCRGAANGGWRRPRSEGYAARSAMPARFDVR